VGELTALLGPPWWARRWWGGRATHRREGGRSETIGREERE